MNRFQFAMSAIVAIAAFAANVGGQPSVARGDDGGAVEGAIWRYQMSKVAGQVTRRGRFRIHGTKIYQPPVGAESTVIGAIEGKFEPPRDKAKVTFNKLYGSDSRSPSFEGRLHREGAGVAVGTLIDAAGFRWEFKAECVRE